MQLERKDQFENWPYRIYMCLFKFVAKNRIEKRDLDVSYIHNHLVVTMTSNILMWAYGFIATLAMNSSIPGRVGLISSVIHLFSPLLFRVTKSHFLVTFVMLAAGVIHQSTFAFYSGGFESEILIWFGIIPLFAGIASGRAAAITWAIIVALVSIAFLFGQVTHYPYPHALTAKGLIVSKLCLIYGWIFLSCSSILAYVQIKSDHEMRLRANKDKINNLLRILIHDLAQPLTSIGFKIAYFRRRMNQGDLVHYKNDVDAMSSSVNVMSEMITSVRLMYATDSGKTHLSIRPYSLNESLNHIEILYADRLKEKRMELQYPKASFIETGVLVDPIIFNNQVMGNIISNAIKFSENGSKIKLWIEKQKEQLEDYIVLYVQDEGIGIPPNIINNIFHPNAATTRKGVSGEAGTGLGMVILKSFLEKMDGRVEVNSVEKNEDSIDHGTTFKIILRAAC